MSFVFGNAQHQGAREQQQDAFGFSNPFDDAFAAHGGFAAIVADGMGGLADGDLAARTALTAFLAAYKAKPAGESIPAALERALAGANVAVCALRRDLGTTLVAAVLHGERLHWISAGDSGLFLYRDGRLNQVNTPHVYGRELDARAASGTIGREAAECDPQRDALTSHLGMNPLPEIDRGEMALQPGDVTLVASDGLFKFLPVPEMETLMNQGGLQDRCDALVEAVVARRAPGQDNITAVALARQSVITGKVTAPSRRPLLISAAALAASLLIGAVLLPRFQVPPPPPVPKTYLKPQPVFYEDAELQPDPGERPRKEGSR